MTLHIAGISSCVNDAVDAIGSTANNPIKMYPFRTMDNDRAILWFTFENLTCDACLNQNPKRLLCVYIDKAEYDPPSPQARASL